MVAELDPDPAVVAHDSAISDFTNIGISLELLNPGVYELLEEVPSERHLFG